MLHGKFPGLAAVLQPPSRPRDVIPPSWLNRHLRSREQWIVRTAGRIRAQFRMPLLCDRHGKIANRHEEGSKSFAELRSDVTGVLIDEALVHVDVTQRKEANAATRAPVTTANATTARLRRRGRVGRHRRQDEFDLSKRGHPLFPPCPSDRDILVAEVEVISVGIADVGLVARQMRKPEKEGVQVRRIE